MTKPTKAPEYSVVARGAGGGGGHTPVESADSLRSTQIAEWVDLVGEGEIGGLVNGLKSVFLDGVPVQNADGTMNFTGFQLYELRGEPGQSPVDGFSQVEQEISVGVQVTHATSATRTVVDTDVDNVRVTLSIPSLRQGEDDGDVVGTSVQWAIDVQCNGGGFVQKYIDTITGKASNGYKKSVLLPVKSFGAPPWDIRLRRITADSTDEQLQNQTWWESYTEIESLKMRYTHSAAFMCRVDARNFSHVPNRAYDVVGVVDWLIPTNYDPYARTYTGVWNGTFKAGFTNNPAWVLYNLVVNPRYGLGKYLPLADKWTLYALGQWCDGQLSNGRGGFEPRYQINAFIQTQVEALQLLQDIAAVFRGAALYGAGQISASWDAPGDPVAQYAPANVVGGVFNYGDGSAKLKRSSCTCWWNDQTQLGKRVPVVWQDDELVAKYGLREMSISPIGVTSPSQALRHAKWALYTQEYEDQIVSFRIGSDGVAGRIGQIFQITDPSETGERLGGRIKSATATVVQLDGTVELLPGETYTLCVTQPDPSDPTALIVEERPVTTAPGVVATLQVFPAFSAPPAAETTWLLAANTVLPTLWRYVAISESRAEGSDGGTKIEYDITGVAYNPGKWDLVELGLKVGERPVRRLADGATAPINLSLEEAVSQDGQKFKSQIIVGWEPTSPGLSYLVSWRIKQGAWQHMQPTRAWSVDIELPALGLVEIEVRAQALDGEQSPPLTGSITALGSQAAASPVTGLNLITTATGVKVTWNLPTDFNWTTTELRLDGTSPDTAQPLADVRATSYLLGWPTVGLHKVWARNKRQVGAPSTWVFAQIDYTGPDPLVNLLDGMLTEEQFDAALQDRLDLIDGFGPGSVNERIAQFSEVGVNLVMGSGFDIDTDANGVADYWTTFIAGSGDAGRVLAKSLVAALNGGGKAQRVEITAATNSNESGVVSIPPQAVVTVGETYTLSGWLRSAATGVRLVARCLNNLGGLVADFVTPNVPTDQLPYRLSVTFSVPASTASCQIFARGINAAGEWLEVDAVQLQTGEMAGPYMPNPADISALQASVNTEIQARVAGDDALAASLTAISAQVAANSAAITDESVARANADSAQATQISGLVAQMAAKGANMVANSSFELDSDGDGLASLWTAYTNGAFGTATSSLVTGRRYGEAQRRHASGLGTTATDRIGVRQQIDVTPGALTSGGAMASVYVRGTSGCTARLTAQARAGTTVKTSPSASIALTGTWQRLSVAVTVAADVDNFLFFAWAEAKTGGGAVDIDVDDAQLEPGGTLNDYAPGAGEASGTYAAVMEERSARVTEDAALATSISAVQADVDDNQAAILAEATARASADSAQASQISTVLAQLNAKGTNQLLNSSFELDSDDNGLTNNWTGYTLGSFGTATSSQVAGRVSGNAQRRHSTGLGTTTNDRIGVWQQVNVSPGAMSEIMASVYVKGTSGATGRLYCEARAGTTIRQSFSVTVALGSSWQRLSQVVTVASDVDNLRFFIWAQAKTGGGAVDLDVDDALFEPGDVLNEYSPGRGEADSAYAAVIEERDARASETGELSAQWSIKVDANGRWAGMITRAGGNESTIDLLADVVRIGSTTFSDRALFAVYTSDTVVNGITVPAGIYMKSAFIETVSADRIVANTLSAIVALLGSVQIGAGGNLRQGQTAYNTGVGFWLGDASGTPKFSIGDPSGNNMRWDGAKLIIETDADNYVKTGVVADGKRLWVGATGLGGANPVAEIQFWSDGNVKRKQNSLVSNYTDWYSPITSGVGSGFWIRFTKVSQDAGTTLGGTLNTWLGMGTTRSMQLTTSNNGDWNAQLKFEISTTSSGSNVVAEGDISLIVSREP